MRPILTTAAVLVAGVAAASDPPPVVPDPPPITRAEFDGLAARVGELERLAGIPPRAMPADSDPYRLPSYAAVLERVRLGLTVRLFVSVPDTAVGTYQLHYRTDALPTVPPGEYEVSMGRGGPVIRPVAGGRVPAAAPSSWGETPAVAPPRLTPASRTGGGDHTHTCGRCGTTFDHSAAGDPAMSHHCPTCGAGPWPVVSGFGGAADRSTGFPAVAPVRYQLPRWFGTAAAGSGCGPNGCGVQSAGRRN